MRRIAILAGLITFSAAAGAQTAPSAQPIIDVHVHAYPSNWVREILGKTATPEEALPDPPNPITGKRSGATTDQALLDATLAAMRQFNIVKVVASGPLPIVRRWHAADPERILGSPLFPIPRLAPFPELKRLEQDYRSGRLSALGEVTAIYEGLSPSGPRLGLYLELAEKLDVPVGIHTGLGIAGASYSCCPGFRIELGRPLHLEGLLVRHPKLRVYVMHAGYPYLDEMIALMGAYPQIYADLAAIDWLLPEDEFHAYLQRLIQAGLGKRLMFGTDQIVWPDAFGVAIERIRSAKFLTEEQKRDIFYNNAARFFRLEKSGAH